MGEGIENCEVGPNILVITQKLAHFFFKSTNFKLKSENFSLLLHKIHILYQQAGLQWFVELDFSQPFYIFYSQIQISKGFSKEVLQKV